MKISNTTKIALGIALLLPLAMYADGTDLLAPHIGNVKATASGSGKTLIYLGELCAAVGAYWGTNNYKVFFGSGFLFLFINFMFGIA